MVLPDSHRVPRVPRYLGFLSRKSDLFRLRDCHSLWFRFPANSTINQIYNFPTEPELHPIKPHDPEYATLPGLTHIQFRLFPVRSPLLGESLLFSFPAGTKMFQFPAFATQDLCVQSRVDGLSARRVSPFGHPRIKACLQLPEAYRSLPRPSSPTDAKASTMNP